MTYSFRVFRNLLPQAKGKGVYSTELPVSEPLDLGNSFFFWGGEGEGVSRLVSLEYSL